ncbi:DUF1800 domain-containing protein [soil metagenome]
MIRIRASHLLAGTLLLIAACATNPGPNATASATHAPLIVVAPTEPREQTADQQVQQVLNRLGFGPRPGDVAKVRAMGVDQWIALQLASDRIDDGAANHVVASYEMLDKPTTELMSMYERGQLAVRQQQKSQAQSGDTSGKKDLRAMVLQGDPQLRDQLRQNQRILGDVQSAKLARAVASERQLDEVMTDFWENHFNIFAGKGVDRMFIPAFDRDVIRPNALGNFRQLLGAVAKSPAMLFYLDQWQSAADSTHPTLAAARGARGRGRMQVAQARPSAAARARRGLNENYARELMELHTLGVDGGYTQQDIIEVARALTGWTMNPRGTAEFVFRPEIHDAGQKVVLGHVIPAGGGVEDGEAVLDILARHPATAHFIARKLAIRLVSDSPPDALVERAAQTFLKTDGNIREVVRTIVTSPEFFSRTAYRSKVKSPFELVASALRAIAAQPDTTMRSAQLVGFLGAPIFGHQAPNGWPETGESWMNSGAILNRINFGVTVAAGRLPGAALAQWSEAEQLKGATRDQQVDAVIQAFFGGQASPDTRQILLSGENPLVTKLAASAPPDSMATDVSSMTMGGGDLPMRGRVGPPAKNGAPRPAMSRAMGQPIQLNGLAQVVGLAIGAPEFQRR